ncbi:MAG: transglutaminase-like domain-containing protein [Elusimicrobiaceae bacterium]|nr:transglutaminase-like domain-containing protein [Elusimicrobiaceae bacterium]
MENDRLKALLKLLSTETDSYGTVLRKEIAAAFKANPTGVRTVLKETFREETPLPVVHTLEEIGWEELSAALAHFATKINPDLEEGLTLLSKFTVPTTSRLEVTILLDEIARAVRPGLLNARNYSEIARTLSHYFFNTLGLQILPISWDIQGIAFSRFLHKHRGSSLCVASLYVLICQRYGVDAGLVDLAGRILVHLKGPQESVFIDPLDNGKILSQDDCRRYIASRQLDWNDNFLTPLSSRQTIRRFIANMIFISNKIHDERRLVFLRRYLDIMQN